MKRWLTIIVLVLALAAIIGWRIQSKMATTKSLSKQSQVRKAAALNVVVAYAKEGYIYSHMNVVGSLTTPYDVKLGSKVAGVVDMLQVRPGDRVTAGEVLVRINPIEQEATAAQDKAQWASAEQSYTKALLTQSPNDVQVKAAVSSGVAAFSQATANENQVKTNAQAQITAAKAVVTDNEAKVSQAVAQQGAAVQAVNSSQANYNDAAAKYAREYTLYKQGMVSAQDTDDDYAAEKVAEASVGSSKQSLDAAQKAVESAKAELESAKQQLAITIKQVGANIVAAVAATKTAKENLNYARSNLAQIPAYVQNLAALKSQAESDKELYENAAAQVQDTILKTPYQGTVVNRLIDPGSMASVGQELLEVQFLDWLYVVCTGPVEYLNNTHVGDEATLTFDALPGQTFHAPIVLVTPSADPTSRQFTFQVKLDNSSGLFKPGMFGHVDVIVGKSKVGVLVPREAIITGDAGPAVQVVDSNNIVHIVQVTTGASDPKNIAVTSGVTAGQRVIILSYQPIKEGSKVTIGGGPGAGGSRKGSATTGSAGSPPSQSPGSSPPMSAPPVTSTTTTTTTTSKPSSSK